MYKICKLYGVQEIKIICAQASLSKLLESLKNFGERADIKNRFW
jgi:hypothetical protein